MVGASVVEVHTLPGFLFPFDADQTQRPGRSLPLQIAEVTAEHKDAATLAS